MSISCSTRNSPANADVSRGVWSQDEHDRFLAALQLYPNGPWKAVAEHVGTRSVRQVQTHAQKYHEKVARRLCGLRKDRKRVQRSEHRIDDEMLEICEELKRDSVPLFAATSLSSKHSLPVAYLPPSTSAEKNVKEDVKVSQIMKNVPVADTFQAVATKMQTETPPASPPCLLDTPSFYECIDYLIEAFCGSDDESAGETGWVSVPSSQPVVSIAKPVSRVVM